MFSNIMTIRKVLQSMFAYTYQMEVQIVAYYIITLKKVLERSFICIIWLPLIFFSNNILIDVVPH